MALSNTNFTLYTRVQFDNKAAVKATEELKKTLKALQTEQTNTKNQYQALADAGDKAAKAAIANINARVNAQRVAIKNAEQDLSMLRKATTQLDNMSLRQLKMALSEANKQMNSLGKDATEQNKLQGLREMMDLINVRIKSITTGFNNAFQAAANGAKMSMTEMENVIKLLEQEGSAIAKNEAHYKQIQNVIQKMRTTLAGKQGFNSITNGLNSGRTQNITDAQLNSYIKFYTEIANSSKSSAQQIEEANKRIEKAQGELTKRASVSGEALRNQVNAGNFAGTVKQAEEAIIKLKEFRKTLDIKDVQGINAVDKAIERLNTNIRKVNETTIAAKNHVEEFGKTGTFSGKTSDELEKIKMALESYRKNLRATGGDAESLKKVQRALVGVGKAQAEINSKSYDWEAFMRKLNTKSLKELQSAYKTLRSEIDTMSQAQKGYNEKAAQMRKIDQQIKSMNKSMEHHASFIENAGKRLVTYVSIYMGFNALMMKAQQAWTNIKELSDQMTNVQKVTGMTSDEIKLLTDRIQDLNTRTSNTTLMELAEQAGKFGIATKYGTDGMLAFVDAGQKIVNTLGDIGGSESINELLKVYDIVNGADGQQGQGVEYVTNALDTVGSAILSIGNNSKASYEGVVEFTKRVGAVGAQSKMTMPQIMALGGTFSSLQGDVTTSANAMQRVIIGLQTNTKKVAEATGTSLKELNSLLNADAEGKTHTFEALLLVLDNIKDKGVKGVDEFLHAIGGRNNQQAKAALSLLTKNLSTLERQLMYAEQGYEDGTLVTQEFEKANSNLAGTMEQVSNEFYEMFANASSATGGLTVMANVILTIVRKFKEWHVIGAILYGFLAAMTAMVLKHVAAVTLDTIAVLKNINTQKTLVGFLPNIIKMIGSGMVAAINRATFAWNGNTAAARKSITAMNDFKKVSTMGNWLTLLATVVMAVYMAWKNWSDAIKNSRKEIGEMKNATNQEITELNKLTKTIRTAKEHSDERMKAIQEFNRKFDPYLSNLIKESNVVSQLAIAYSEVAAAINEKAAASIRENAGNKAREKYGDKIDEATGAMLDTFSKRGKGDQNDNVTKVQDFIQSYIENNPNADVSSVKSSVIKKFEKDKNFRATKLMSVFGYGDVNNAILDYIEAYQGYNNTYNLSSSQASVYDKRADFQKANKFNLLTTKINPNSPKSKNLSNRDRVKAAEEAIKVYGELSSSSKNKNAKTFDWVTRQYNSYLSKGNPWGETPEDWSQMSGDDLKALVDYYNEIYIKYKGGKINTKFSETIGQYAPTGAKVPDAIDTWNKNNIRDWAKKMWDAAVKQQNINYANKNGIFQQEKEKKNAEGKDDMDAALKKLDEYYKRQEEMINNDLNNQLITQEEANRRLLANEAEHLEERQNLRTKFINTSWDFGHDYIEALMDGTDWDKINQYVTKQGDDMYQTIRLNMAKDAAKIQSDARSFKEGIYKTLFGENNFTKLFETFKTNLDLKEMLLPGLSKDENGNYTDLKNEIEQRMAYIMQIMADASMYNAGGMRGDMMNMGGTVMQWALGLTDEQIEDIRQRTIKLNTDYNKELRKEANEIKKQIDEQNAENGFDLGYSQREKNLGWNQAVAGGISSLAQSDNIFGLNPSEDMELQLYDLKIEKSNEYIEQIKREMQMKIANATTDEERQRLQREQAYLVADEQQKINDTLMEQQKKQAELAFAQVEKFRPYADMVNQFAEDFGSNIFGNKEDREKAAKALLTSFVKTTGTMLSQYLSYLATRDLADSTFKAKEVGKLGSLAVGEVAVNSARGVSQEVGRNGIYGFAIGAAITAAMTALMALITSQINKTQNELGASTGKLATGMLTYANGRYPTYSDGTVMNVQGSDGQNYNAVVKPNLTTGEYNRPHLGIVGEKGAELIIDHNTYMGLKQRAPHILQGIYDMHNYGRTALDYGSISSAASLLGMSNTRSLLTARRGVKTYAEGNVNDILGGAISDAESLGGNDRLSMALEQNNLIMSQLMTQGIKAKINMYGKDELYESLQKANKFMSGK